LLRSVFILYLICFGCYILFTRQPDYFDGEKAPATIQNVYDSASKQTIPVAVYQAGGTWHKTDARYFLRPIKFGQKVTVIYETATPEIAAVYAFWGYWIGWGELLFSVVGYVLLLQIAYSVTTNPNAESFQEQLSYKPENKRKYND
jgi:hypothetical protein